MCCRCVGQNTKQIPLRLFFLPLQVKGIQDEYQNFMEKVRGKAQTAIDMANRHFEADRTELTSQVDVLVHVMQQRFYLPVIPRLYIHHSPIWILLAFCHVCSLRLGDCGFYAKPVVEQVLTQKKMHCRYGTSPDRFEPYLQRETDVCRLIVRGREVSHVCRAKGAKGRVL